MLSHLHTTLLTPGRNVVDTPSALAMIVLRMPVRSIVVSCRRDLQRGVKVLRCKMSGCRILQPDICKTVLAEEGQQCESAGVFLDGWALHGPALGCSASPCLSDPFGSLILVERNRYAVAC